MMKGNCGRDVQQRRMVTEDVNGYISEMKCNIRAAAAFSCRCNSVSRCHVSALPLSTNSTISHSFTDHQLHTLIHCNITQQPQTRIGVMTIFSNHKKVNEMSDYWCTLAKWSNLFGTEEVDSHQCVSWRFYSLS